MTIAELICELTRYPMDAPIVADDHSLTDDQRETHVAVNCVIESAECRKALD